MTTWVEAVDAPMTLNGEPVIVLVAADPDSYERIAKCKKGVKYRVEPKRDNNSDFHRLVMRLLRDLYEAQEQFDSEDVHREYVKLQCGWVYEARIPSADAERLEACAKWLRQTADKCAGIPVVSMISDGLRAAADLVESCVTQLVTRPLSFDKCDQAEREEFFRRLKEYAGPVIGWERVESYEGQL